MLKEIPDPVIEVEIEPEAASDRKKLQMALSWLTREDPYLRVATDDESGQTVIGGRAELHLEKAIVRLKQEFNLDVRVGAPQVAYRETITRKAEVEHTYKKQEGAAGQFARVAIRFEPLERGAGLAFDSAVVGSAVPKQYVSAVEKGLRSAVMRGVHIGFPVTDMKMTLIDGAAHDNDSSAMAFEIAGHAAFQEGATKAGLTILEPVMRVEVMTPEEFLGDIIGDLKRRRGTVNATDTYGDVRMINAMVPLVNMLGYVNNLREMSRGLAQFAMHFDHYDTVPDSDPDPDPSTPAIAKRA